MKKTLSVGLFSLALFAILPFALTTNVYAAMLPQHSSLYCLAPASGSVIYLQAHANGEFVTADPNNGGSLSADSTTQGTWQRFDLIFETSSSSTAAYLRAHANGEYVTADLNGGSFAPLRANSATLGTWQRFDWNCIDGYTISLGAHANGEYVTADLNGGSLAPLRANSTTVGTWQRFDWRA